MEEQTVKSAPISVPVYFQGYILPDVRGEVELRPAKIIHGADIRLSAHHDNELDPIIRNKIQELYKIPPDVHIGIKGIDISEKKEISIEYIVYRVDSIDPYHFNNSDLMQILVHVNMKGGGAKRSRRARRKGRRSRSHRRT